MLEDTVRHPQPAHVGFLRRRHVEQAVVLPAEGVGGLGEFVVRRLLLEPRIGVKRVLLALDLLLFVELAAASNGLILREDVLGVGAGRDRVGRLAARQTAAGTGDLQARGEAFEIALLLGGEIAGHAASSQPQPRPYGRRPRGS